MVQVSICANTQVKSVYNFKLLLQIKNEMYYQSMSHKITLESPFLRSEYNELEGSEPLHILQTSL